MPATMSQTKPPRKRAGNPNAATVNREPMIDPREIDAAIGPGAETMTARERFEALMRRVLGGGRAEHEENALHPGGEKE